MKEHDTRRKDWEYFTYKEAEEECLELCQYDYVGKIAAILQNNVQFPSDISHNNHAIIAQ